MVDENDELMDEFVSEALEGLSNIENELLAIEESSENLDLDLVNKVFRTIHSVKGISGFLGLETIGHLAHDIENCLALIRSRDLEVNESRIDVILRASDALRTLINDVKNSNGQDVSAHLAELKAVARGAKKAGEAPPAEAPADQAPKAASQMEQVAAPTPPEPIAAKAPAAEQAAPCAEKVEPVVPQAAPAPKKDSVAALPETHGEHDGAKADEAATAKVADQSVRVPVALLDRLMNMAGELVLERNRLMQTISVKDFESIGSVASRIDQVTSEMQEAVMQTRMQPIGNVFTRFPRIVRDLGKQLGKKIELEVVGKDVEVDKTIVEAIGDPLTHLIRNAVDHGVETPTVRQGRGKNPVGRIDLSAYHQGGKVNIVIADDGGGIDPEKLRAKALAKGVITAEEARTMDDREALTLIFRAGFSTAEQVTSVSGRGVGMDVVRTNIEKLGGTIEIDTKLGLGTSFHLTLPLTLAIIPSLVVIAEGRYFAIPQVSISEVVRIKGSDAAKRIERIKGAEVFRLREKLLPLVRLARAVGIDPAVPPVPVVDRSKERAAVEIDGIPGDEAPNVQAGDGRAALEKGGTGAIKIVVVEVGRLSYGIVVDTIFDSKEIVVKPLGRHLKNVQSLAGATILGDGGVALILDIAGVAASCNLRQPIDDGGKNGEMSQRDALREVQTVLIFSNARDQFFALPMSLVSRIDRVKREDISQIAGRELMQNGNRSMPLLGLENCIKAAPRPDQDRYYVVVFNVKEREAGLVAPTLVDIRQLADQIDTGILMEPGVSGSVVVNGHVTRLIDLFEITRMSYPEWFNEDSASSRNRPCVLLAEDNPFFRSQIRGFLASAGYSVICCEDGSAAWDTVSRTDNAVQAVVTDVDMPRIDGLELTRRIRSDPALAHLPVIMVTSLQSEADVQRGRDAGATEYQHKFSREKLQTALTRCLTAETPVKAS